MPAWRRWRIWSESQTRSPVVESAAGTRVEKPWGYEIRWAVTDLYLGKVLHINAGEALSLQYHERKDESMLLVSGLLELELEGEDGLMRVHRLRPGDTVRIPPGRRHRPVAIEECEIFEVSTPHVDDVVRLEDRYGRGAQAADKIGGK